MKIEINLIKKYGMKNIVLIIVTLLITGVIGGCRRTEEERNTANVNEEGNKYYISFVDAEKDVFVKELLRLNIGEDTLLIGVNRDYSEKVVIQLNEFLKEKGYDFNVMFCRLPHEQIINKNLPEFMQYLKNQGVGIDIFPVWRSNLKMVIENELLMDISEEIQEESKLKASFFQKFWEVSAVDGKNYGMGSYYVYSKAWAVNKELMDKYGFTKEDLSKEITEMEEILRTVSEGESDPNFAALVYEPRFLLENIPFVYADTSLPIGYWQEEESKGYVVNLFDTDKMEELVATMNHYYQEGYVKIGNNIPEQTSFFMHTDYAGYPIRRSDSLDTWTNFAGIDLVRVPYCNQTTNDLAYVINGVASWSEKQEQAWEFLNFIYTDEEASTLLRYGIEGEDYSMSGDMAVAGENLSENIIYNRSLGNLQLAVPLSPYEDASKNVLVEEELNNLQDSFLTGFVFNTKPVQKEVDAVRGLYMELSTIRTAFAFEKNEEYECWEEYYEVYKNELKDAGIDRIVDEMNRQIQEYLQK